MATPKKKGRLYDRVKFDHAGRPPAFDSPEQMWEVAQEYFEWCEENPFVEPKLFNSQGEILQGEIPHMRAMTKAGLCTFLNIGESTFRDYKNKPQYSAVMETIDRIMYEQKFSGAAAGRLKENIIMRDLGLVDKQETATSATVINIVQPSDQGEFTEAQVDAYLDGD